MKQLKDLEFVLSEKGKFIPRRNVDILFPYLVEVVEEEGIADLQQAAIELAERFKGYKTDLSHPLYIIAELVSPQFGLKTIRFRAAIQKCYPDVDETRGFHSRRDSVLLYKEETALLKYIRSITVKRNIVIVGSKEEGEKMPVDLREDN